MSDRIDPWMPGGDQAVDEGCRCPVLDNGHGNTGLARDRGGWIVVSDCPLHAAGGRRPVNVEPSQ